MTPSRWSPTGAPSPGEPSGEPPASLPPTDGVPDELTLLALITPSGTAALPPPRLVTLARSAGTGDPLGTRRAPLSANEPWMGMRGPSSAFSWYLLILSEMRPLAPVERSARDGPAGADEPDSPWRLSLAIRSLSDPIGFEVLQAIRRVRVSVW